MKQVIMNRLCWVLGLLLPVGMAGCIDSFDDHYSEGAGVAPHETLWQLIEQDANLSAFKALAEATGYDALLKSSQAFTVFAPVNEVLSGLDLTTADEADLKDIIRTHIARFKYTAGSGLPATVYTLNAKRIPFEYSGTNYTMSGSELEQTNRLASNGILHTMSRQIPFVKSIWEHLTDPKMDSIRRFFDSFHSRIFIPSSSKVVDYAGGFAVYDSMFVESNALWRIYSSYGGSAVGYLNGIGFINEEDSVYTMLLPTNEAWKKAYDDRFPYFETTAANSDSLQHLNTQYSIIQDLVFRGKIEDTAMPDSLISTQNNVFKSPANLFAGATPLPASNGLVYTTNELKHTYWESWQHPLTVEAERGITWLKENTADVPPGVIYTYLPDKQDIPSERCLLISYGMQSTGANTVILFDVPNTLKAVYNVYAVFAPMRYTDKTANAERTRIRYDIQQLDRSTAMNPVNEQVWTTLVGATNANGVAPNGVSALSLDAATDSMSVKKMLLRANFALPEANYNERTTTIRIKLISMAVTSSEDRRNGFRNRMLLDKIIFEPVH